MAAAAEVYKEREELISQKDSEIAELKSDVQALNTTKDTIIKDIALRDNKIAEYEQDVEELRGNLAEKEGQLAEYREKLASLESRVEELEPLRGMMERYWELQAAHQEKLQELSSIASKAEELEAKVQGLEDTREDQGIQPSSSKGRNQRPLRGQQHPKRTTELPEERSYRERNQNNRVRRQGDRNREPGRQPLGEIIQERGGNLQLHQENILPGGGQE